jgi:hypothetical protein
MRKIIVALALLGSSASAGAVTFVGEISGTVTSSFSTVFTAADAKPDFKIGDTITARFSFVQAAPSRGSLAAVAGNFLASKITDQISFELGGHRWTSRGDFLLGLVPLAFGPPADPLRDMYLTTDDAPGAGDLRVQGYAFEIGEFGYQLYQGHGYAGAFNKATLKVWADGQRIIGETARTNVSAVPEPANWAMMIGGFGLLGGALRTARRKLALSFAAA